MPALSAQHLRKAFGPQVVLDDATFALARGEKVGLIGANGAGKSTLAKILAGIESPDGGTLSVRRGLAVRYLSQEPEIDPSASARAVVEDALTAWRQASSRHAQVTARLADPTDSAQHDALVKEQAELDETIVRLGGWERGHEALGFLDKLGVRDVDRPCGLRSGGERRRIALAQLLVASPDIAILDEPTNHLDADTAAWLEELLDRRFRGALVLVTHDRYFLDAVATRIVELERGKLVSYAGGYGDYLEKKAELLAHEERVEQNRKNALRREREWLARGPKARGTKQKARIMRAVALESAVPATSGRPGEVSLVTGVAPQQGKTVLELHGVRVAAVAGGPPLHTPLDLIVTAGERIGVVGPNGAGKTTLLRAVLAAVEETRRGERPEGAPALIAGSIVVGKNTRVAYLDQARAGLDESKSIFDDVRGEGGTTTVRLGVRGREAMDLRSYLELFLFDPNKQRQKVGSLSGGERARVAIAKMLRGEANLLVLDEPTNDLDLPTLTALEGLLEDYEGSAIVVTHDRAFLDRVATAILAFESDRSQPGLSTVIRYAGGYEDYVAQRRQSRETGAGEAREEPEEREERVEGEERRKPESGGPGTAHAPEVVASAPSKRQAKRAPLLTYAERIEFEGIVSAVDEAEKRVAEIEALLGDPELYAKRGHEVAGLKARLIEAKDGAARLLERWEALEAKSGRPLT
jgi:ATP-binding cassette subfamily F protein uup